MGNPYPAQFTDDEGEARLTGEIAFTDQANQPGGGSQPGGAGSPLGSVTPTAVGETYVDTTNGGLYIASGLTDADWVCVGGASAVYGALGLFLKGVPGNYNSLSVVGDGAHATAITDLLASLSSGNGVYWTANGTDGQQVLNVYVGDNGAFTVSVLANGVLDTSSASGVKFPTADPHVAGAWWDNAGTLTRSAG